MLKFILAAVLGIGWPSASYLLTGRPNVEVHVAPINNDVSDGDPKTPLCPKCAIFSSVSRAPKCQPVQDSVDVL